VDKILNTRIGEGLRHYRGKIAARRVARAFALPQTRYELALLPVWTAGVRSGENPWQPRRNFRGSFTALVTPFKTARSTRRRFRGCNCKSRGNPRLVPVGTTGESPTVNHDEHKRVVEWCINEAGAPVPVIAGAGSNSTRSHRACRACRARRASALVDAILQQADPGGLYQHFKRSMTDRIPIIIYNIPGRSVIDMTVDTMARLFELKKHRRRKDATRAWCAFHSSVQRWARISTSCRRERHRTRLHGAWRHGASRLPPTSRPLCSEFHLACRRAISPPAQAARQADAADTNLFIESNPSPVKIRPVAARKIDEKLRLRCAGIRTTRVQCAAPCACGLIN